MRLAHVTHPPVVTQAPVWCPAPSPQAMNADASPDLVVQIVWHQPAILTTVMVESALMMLTETLSAQSVLLASQEHNVTLARVPLLPALMRAPALCQTKHPQALFASVNQVSAVQTAKQPPVTHTTVMVGSALTM